MYEYYFNSWNYVSNETKSKKNEKKYQELAPEKTVFFIRRNQDSSDLFIGGSGFLNAFSLMKAFYINPEDIQIVFLDNLIPQMILFMTYIKN